MVRNNKYINITKKEAAGKRAAEKKSVREEERRTENSEEIKRRTAQESRLQEEYDALVKESGVIVDGYQKLRERTQKLEEKCEREAEEGKILKKRLQKAAEQLEAAQAAAGRARQLEEYVGRLQRSNQYLLERCQELEEENIALKAELHDMITEKIGKPGSAEKKNPAAVEPDSREAKGIDEPAGTVEAEKETTGFYDFDDEKDNTEEFEQESIWELMDEDTDEEEPLRKKADERSGEDRGESPSGDQEAEHLRRVEDSDLFLLNVQSDVSRTIEKVQERIQGLFQK